MLGLASSEQGKGNDRKQQTVVRKREFLSEARVHIQQMHAKGRGHLAILKEEGGDLGKRSLGDGTRGGSLTGGRACAIKDILMGATIVTIHRPPVQGVIEKNRPGN